MRNYNKQRRDNERLPSRNSSSGRREEGRSPRPRLNRDMVDRAWESGAQPNHPDYHTRNDRQGPSRGSSPRNNRQQNRYSSSAQQSRNNRRPFENHQGNNRYSERTPYNNYNSRSRSSDFRPGQRDEQRYHERQSYSERSGQRPSRSGYRGNSRYSDSHPQSRNQHSRGGYSERDFGSNNRSSRNFEHTNRTSHNYSQHGEQNPRYLSRPDMQRSQSHGRSDFSRQVHQNPQFEGDYESYNTYETPRQQRGRYPDHSASYQEQAEERHVTRLDDGRVLKGSRPAQRKNAQFWTGIAQEADKLLPQADTSSTRDEARQHIETGLPAPTKRERLKTTAKARKPRSSRTRVTSAPKSRTRSPKP